MHAKKLTVSGRTICALIDPDAVLCGAQRHSNLLPSDQLQDVRALRAFGITALVVGTYAAARTRV